MRDKILLSASPLACAFLMIFASLSAASAEANLMDRIIKGISNEAEFDFATSNQIPESLTDTEPIIKRGLDNSLVHFESLFPIRLKRSAQLGEDPTPAIRFLGLLRDEMGVNDLTGMRLNRVRELAGGRLEHRFRQFSAEYPVLNSKVSVVVDPDGGLLRLSGRYLPDGQMRSLQSTLPSFWDLAEAFPAGTGEIFAGLGIFHGSMFGMTTWKGRAPTIAFVTIRRDSQRGYSQTYLDWQTGETLYSVPLNNDVLPPIDIYDDVDCMYSDPYFYLDAPIMMESNQTCGAGDYNAGCSWWPGDSTRIKTTVNSLANYFDSEFSRYSWDGGQMPECDPSDPTIDVNQCCNLTDPSVMTSAANWIGDDYTEQACCASVWGNFCPGDIWGVTYENSFFIQFGCYTAFSHGTSCTDTIGHEFAHGIDFAEKQTSRCTADDSNGLYCRHEEAMAEALPDIIGEAFQRTSYPTEGTPWMINDGQTYCSAVRNLQSPSDADHASTLDWYNSERGTRMHSNSTSISKGFYLLGRPESDGAVSHYGVSVTGIGITDATKVFYHAITEDLPDTTDRTFSDLRQALLSSAGSTFGYSSAQYTATQNMVNAMGYWTSPTSWVQSVASQPGLGIFGTPGLVTNRHRTVVYQDSDSLKYRYRYQTYTMPPSYVWSTPATIVSTTRSFDVYTETRLVSGLPLDYRLHVYYLDATNKIRHFRIAADGSTADNPVLLNRLAVTVVSGSTIRVVEGETLKLFYVPNGTTTVKYASLTNNTLSGELNTSIPVTSGYDVDYLGGRYHAFWIANNVLQHMVSYSSGQWISQMIFDQFLNTTDYAITSYYGTLHVLTNNTLYGWNYQTCSNDCTQTDDWTTAAPIDSKPDADSQWAVLAGYYNENFDLGLALSPSTGNMLLRSKHSQ